jgi:hypothetical protein
MTREFRSRSSRNRGGHQPAKPRRSGRPAGADQRVGDRRGPARPVHRLVQGEQVAVGQQGLFGLAAAGAAWRGVVLEPGGEFAEEAEVGLHGGVRRGPDGRLRLGWVVVAGAPPAPVAGDRGVPGPAGVGGKPAHRGDAAAVRWTSCSVSASRAAPSSAACGGTAANAKVTRWEMAAPTVAHG